jgi:hypothetical protein
MVLCADFTGASNAVFVLVLSLVLGNVGGVTGSKLFLYHYFYLCHADHQQNRCRSRALLTVLYTFTGFTENDIKMVAHSKATDRIVLI